MNCLMEGCTNTKRSCKNTSICFFSFPNIPAMRAKWIWACNANVKSLPKKPFVCSKHFLDKDILKRNEGPPRLNRGAFPLPPEGCARRKVALSLTDCTIFVKASSGILLLNSNDRVNHSMVVADAIADDDCHTHAIDQDVRSEYMHEEFVVLEQEFENVQSDHMAPLSDDQYAHSVQDEDLEFLRIERLDNLMDEYAVPTDDEEISLLTARSSQYFKCCVSSCSNTSKNSELKFYKFRTDEFSRSMWCEKIGLAEELVNSNTKICANHFIYPNDFKADGNLKPYAVPAVNLPGGPRLVQSIMPIRTTRF